MLDLRMALKCVQVLYRLVQEKTDLRLDFRFITRYLLAFIRREKLYEVFLRLYWGR